MTMNARFIILHQPEPPAYYDIIIDRGNSASSFRIAQFDMLALLDGTEVLAREVDAPSGQVEHDTPFNCSRGAFRQFDSGACFIERWQPPVIILQLDAGRFFGTLHILKIEEGYSLRYVRKRSAKSPRP